MENNNTTLQKPLPPAYLRWAILVFASFAMFGNYYIYDSISPVSTLLQDQLGFTEANVGTLMGIYSLPNLVMVIIGGIIIDRIGTRISTFVFSLLCLLGAILTAWEGDLYVMAAGRLVFGLGAESLIVAVTTVVAKWFKGKQLAFAFGINIAIARAGSILAYKSPEWFESYYINWQDPLWIAVIAGIVMFLAVIVYWVMDVAAGRKYDIGREEKQDEFRLADILNFPKSYWILVIVCVTFYSTVFPFKTFSYIFFKNVHGLAESSTGDLLWLLETSAIFATPLLGLLADYFGRRSFLMMMSSVAMLPVFLLLAHTDVSHYLPMAMLGISYSMIPAIIWPSVAILVDEKRLGTALGVMTMIQQVGLLVVNILIGYFNDVTGGYSAGMWVFTALAAIGLVFLIILRRVETGPDGHGLEEGMKKNA